jgi:hypothetical protein
MLDEVLGGMPECVIVRQKPGKPRAARAAGWPKILVEDDSITSKMPIFSLRQGTGSAQQSFRGLAEKTKK